MIYASVQLRRRPSLDIPLPTNYQILAIAFPNSKSKGHSLQHKHFIGAKMLHESDRILVGLSEFRVQSIQREDLNARLAWISNIPWSRNIQMDSPTKIVPRERRIFGQQIIKRIDAEIQGSKARLRARASNIVITRATPRRVWWKLRKCY